MFHYEWLFVMQAIMTILMLVFLRKLNQLKMQIDKITQEVLQYITYVTEDFALEKIQEPVQNHTKKQQQKQGEEAQNRLIQAVLQDFFP